VTRKHGNSIPAVGLTASLRAVTGISTAVADSDLPATNCTC
jgi:hypothetical protein